MQKVKKTCESDLAVAVSRFGEDPIPMCLPEGSTVGDALEKAGIEVSRTEKMYVDGEEAALADILEDGDVLSIVTPKHAGLYKAYSKLCAKRGGHQ